MNHASDVFNDDDSAADGLAEFEQQLGSLIPTSSLDRDRLLFEAGVAHEVKQRHAASRYAAPLRYASVAVAASLLTMLTLSLSNTDTEHEKRGTPLLATDADRPTDDGLHAASEQNKLLDSVVLRPRPSPSIQTLAKPIEFGVFPLAPR